MSQQREETTMPVGRPVNQIYRRCGFKARGGSRPKGRCNEIRVRDGVKMEYVYPIGQMLDLVHESVEPDQRGAGTLACPKHFKLARARLRKLGHDV